MKKLTIALFFLTVSIAALIISCSSTAKKQEQPTAVSSKKLEPYETAKIDKTIDRLKRELSELESLEQKKSADAKSAYDKKVRLFGNVQNIKSDISLLEDIKREHKVD